MSSRITKTWTQENTWRCNSCGDPRQLGRHMKCQLCGSPKEKDEEDIVPEANTSKAVTDPTQLQQAAAGPDWACDFCQGRVRNSDGKCVTCAAPREEKPKFEVTTHADGTVKSIIASGGVHVTSDAAGAIRAVTVNGEPLIGSDGRYAGGGKPPKPPNAKHNWDYGKYWKKSIYLCLIAFGLGAFICLLVTLFGKHEIKVKVTQVTWLYTSQLHQKTLMHGKDWGSRTSSPYSVRSMPNGYGPKSDGFNVACEGKYAGVEDCDPYQCHAHTVTYDCNCRSYDCSCRTSQNCTSNRNGYSTCTEVETCSTCTKCESCSKTEYDTCYHSCNVYKDWCSFDYYEWPVVATGSTGGTNHKVFWPELKADGPDQRLDRFERYEIVFTTESEDTKFDSWKYAPGGLAEFDYFATGAKWIVDVNRVGLIWPKHVATE